MPRRPYRKTENGTKECSVCGIIKSEDDFFRRASNKEWFTSECRDCMRQRNRDDGRKRDRLILSLKNARSASQRTGKAFNITINDMEQMWEDLEGQCFYTNQPMSRGWGQDNTVSIDRIDSSRGYVMGNVVLCCIAINRMKLDHSTKSFLRWTHYVSHA